MRPITKVFLLIVIAFVAYLLWPRTADLKGFNPEEMAKLKVADWTAQRDGKKWDALVARFKIYTSQYHFSPVGAYRMAQSQEAALAAVKASEADKSNNVAESRALSAFTEKYAMMKRDAKENTEPDSLAREEIAWWTLIMEKAPLSEVEGPITHIMAARYGGVAEDYVDVASNLAYAQQMVFASQDRDSESGMSPVDYAREGYKLLKEIAATPPKDAQPAP
jgi:hypothetical protein